MKRPAQLEHISVARVGVVKGAAHRFPCAVADEMTIDIGEVASHRAASGADGARLLQTVTRYLEHPLLLLV